MELVKPIKDFPNTSDQAHVGETLHTLVQRKYVTEHLRRRHLLGVIKRYGKEASVEAAAASIYKAYRLHNEGELGVFVLQGETGAPIGLATVDAYAKLRVQPHARTRLSLKHLPQPWVLPPIAARGPFIKDKPVPGPQVCAWVAPGQGQEGLRVLTTAYAALSQPDGLAASWFNQFAELSDVPHRRQVRAWTTEPKQSADWVREALSAAGMKRLETGYYDDGESRLQPPPPAGYYEYKPPMLQALDTPQ